MQQINFYLEEFQPNREPFRSQHILALSVVFLLLFVLITVKTIRGNHDKLAQIDAASIQVQELKNQVQQFANRKTEVNIVELDNKIVQLQQEISRRQQLLQVISWQKLGNDTGFSSQLEAMARQSSAQISLEIFSIKQGGEYLELVGKTTRSDQLPAYIRALQTESAFQQVKFGVVNIEPVVGNSGEFHFILAEPESLAEKDSLSAVQIYLKNKKLKRGELK